MSPTAILYAIEPTGFAKSGEFAPLVVLALIFFLGLLLLFGFAVGWRVLPLWRRARGLEKLTAKLRRQHHGMIRSAEVWDNQVAPELAAIPYLSEAAQEFREQCWHLDGELFNANQASESFHDDVVDPGHSGFGGAVPGLLTAIGILGTFVGITIGLNEVATAFAEGSGTAAEQAALLSEAISGLVAALGVSFRTSIWGLVFSMLATASMTRMEGRLRGALGDLVRWIDGAIGRGTEHTLLLKLVDLQNKQLTELQGLAEDITTGFESAINGSDGQGGLAGILRDVSNKVAKSQSEGVEGLVNHFIDEMNDKLGQRFDGLGGSIDQMVAANSSYQASMGGLVTKLDASTEAQERVAQTVAESVRQSNEAVEKVGATVEALSASADSVRSASEGIGSVLQQQSAVIDRQEAVSSTLVEALQAQEQGWRTHQQAIAETYEGMQARFDALAASVTALVEWHDRVKSELKDQVETWSSAVATQKELTAQFARERQKTSELLEGLGGATAAFRDLGAGLQDLAEQLRSQVDDAKVAQNAGAEKVEAAAGHLDAVGKTLGETWERYRGFAAELNAGLPAVTSLLEEIVASVEVQRGVVQQGRAVADEMKQTAAAQKELKAGLEAIARAGDATRQALQPVAEAISKGASVLNEAAEGLASSSQGARELSAGLRESVQTLSRQQTEASATWQKVSTALQQTSTQLDRGMTEYSQKVNANLQSALGQFDKELNAAVSSLGEAIYSLQDTIEMLDTSAGSD